MILAELLRPLLGKNEQQLRIIDGGAGSGALPCDCWTTLPPGMVVSYGFDVDFGGLLWSKRERRLFRQTVNPAGASLYPPNLKLVRRFRSTDGGSLADHLRVAKETEVDCTTIDDWRESAAIPTIDFIKLNVQGAELPILEGANGTLPDVLGLQLEASFVESYTGEPMFADLDQFVRKHGFAFFDILAPNVVGRVKSPVSTKVPQIAGGFRWPSKQVFEGHFLWLRDPIAVGMNLPDDKVLKLACIAEIYGQIEYAFELLEWLKERYAATGAADEAEALGTVIQAAATRYRRLLSGYFPGAALRKVVKLLGRTFYPDRPLFLR